MVVGVDISARLPSARAIRAFRTCDFSSNYSRSRGWYAHATTCGRNRNIGSGVESPPCVAPALGLGGLRGPASKHPFRQSAKRENAGTAILVPDCPVFRNSLGIFAAIRRASSGAVRLRVPRRSKILAGTMFPINCSLIMVPGDITHHSFNRGADDCGRSVAHNSCQRLGLGLARRMGMGRCRTRPCSRSLNR